MKNLINLTPQLLNTILNAASDSINNIIHHRFMFYRGFVVIFIFIIIFN